MSVVILLNSLKADILCVYHFICKHSQIIHKSWKFPFYLCSTLHDVLLVLLYLG